jgi:hypothetical protein
MAWKDYRKLQLFHPFPPDDFIDGDKIFSRGKIGDCKIDIIGAITATSAILQYLVFANGNDIALYADIGGQFFDTAIGLCIYVPEQQIAFTVVPVFHAHSIGIHGCGWFVGADAFTISMINKLACEIKYDRVLSCLIFIAAIVQARDYAEEQGIQYQAGRYFSRRSGYDVHNVPPGSDYLGCRSTVMTDNSRNCSRQKND